MGTCFILIVINPLKINAKQAVPAFTLTACVATPHTLPVNYEELQNQRVECVWYARGFLIDGLPFQLLTSLKLALSDGLQCRLKVSNLTKLKP